MISRPVRCTILLALLGSLVLANGQISCMKKCLRKFLYCARTYDSGCCDSYVPCMRDTCKAQLYPCEQQSSKELKRGSWNKRSDIGDDLQLYDLLMSRTNQLPAMPIPNQLFR